MGSSPTPSQDLNKVSLQNFVSSVGEPVAVNGSVQPMAPTELATFHASVRDRGAVCVILAAGQGSRFIAPFPKVIHPFAGKPMAQHAIDAAAAAGVPAIVVVGHARDKVCETLHGKDVAFIVQEQQMGTGHAVYLAKCALPADFTGDIVVLYADNPGVDGALIDKLLLHHDANKETYGSKYGAMILTGSRASAGPGADAYGRIVRESKSDAGPVIDIVEKKTIMHMASGTLEATKTYGKFSWTSAELDAIDEFNSGIVVARAGAYLKVLADIVATQTKLEPAKFEYYATDFVKGMVGRGMVAEGWLMPMEEMWKLEGANTLDELKTLETNQLSRAAKS
jgi:bifunctional N-acetylglucosamine-1-phosphate-uridyltransferase/glucosamine-1-phosphate-acetyltransferase GlmU-like protein